MASTHLSLSGAENAGSSPVIRSMRKRTDILNDIDSVLADIDKVISTTNISQAVDRLLQSAAPGLNGFVPSWTISITPENPEDPRPIQTWADFLGDEDFVFAHHRCDCKHALCDDCGFTHLTCECIDHYADLPGIESYWRIKHADQNAIYENLREESYARNANGS